MSEEFEKELVFGLVCEGPTDQKVISNILDGYFGKEIITNRLVPLGDATDLYRAENYSNWLKVIEYCESEELLGALEGDKFVIVQIDTDVCEQKGFDVLKSDEQGKPLSPQNLQKKVKQRLIKAIGDKRYQLIQKQVVFAICIHSLECWLLPLYTQQKRDYEKVNNCLHILQKEFNKKSKSKIKLSAKKSRDYDKVSSRYRKTKDLKKLGLRNPSLSIFVEELDATFKSSKETGTHH